MIPTLFPKKTLPLAATFPIAQLRSLDFGSADGHRNDFSTETLILTSSVKTFLENKHTLIIGAIGTGKSTLFKIIKENNKKYPNFSNDLIVPLEESISFRELNEFAKEVYHEKDEKHLYQLIWKFNILLKVAIKISSEEGFPKNTHEHDINEFLSLSESSNTYESVIKKLRNILSGANIKFEAKIGDTPINIEAGIKKETTDKTARKFNLEEIQTAISKSIEIRSFSRATVIIDKIDKFVAGIEYKTQRLFITALVELDDDLASDKFLKLKIFLRNDLFERLEFHSIGYDKVNDNVLRLTWSKDEILRFMATRIIYALKKANIATTQELSKSSDLTEFNLGWRDKLLLNPYIPKFFHPIIIKGRDSERASGLYTKFGKMTITKVFPREVIHFSTRTLKHEKVNIFEFLDTHFLDGNNSCTPRYLLIFLKETVSKTATYYDNNPDQSATLLKIENDYEWDLFKKKCVYSAYITSKDIFAKNIAGADEKWTTLFNTFLTKRGNKKNFDYKWIKNNFSDIEDQEAIDFLAFMQVIGYLKISSHNPDIKKREYELPILYTSSPPIIE